jgi:hypothetical protein
MTANSRRILVRAISYFDVKKNKCKKFNYGGCEGNANNFKKKAECREKCKVR